MKKRKIIIKPLLFDTYLAMIKNSVGSKIFQTGYAKVNGRKADITKKGRLSCALFVSSLLKIFGLIDDIHATVGGTVKAMKKLDWTRADELKPGCVLVWEEKIQPSGRHRHIGFYIGNQEAVSNDPSGNKPIKHHLTFGRKNSFPVRKIELIYWQPKFMRHGQK